MSNSDDEFIVANTDTVYVSICPICKDSTDSELPRSSLVCKFCITRYGIKSEKGETISFGIDDLGIYRRYKNKIDEEHECFINGIPCYAYDSLGQILIVTTKPIQKKVKKS